MLKKEEVQFPKLTKKLHNEHTNEICIFTLRPFEPGDEQGMIECIRDEYGDSYFKRDFYDPEKLREKAMSDHYVFFAAEADGEIAGMQIFVLFTEDGDDYIETASQILRLKYRGFGLAPELVSYTFPIAEAMQPKAHFVYAVTFHTITQKVFGVEQGMVPTGFRLGTFLTEKMHNNYPKGKCPKYSEGVLILPISKKDAGTVYLPEELFDYASDCYERLGMRYRLCSERMELPDQPAELAVVIDDLQQTVMIHILKSGRNLSEQISRIMEGHTQPCWSCHVTVSADCGYAIAEYEQLCELGFFFTGIKAACGAKEQFFMQWCGDMELHMEEYTLLEDFQTLRDEIQRFYDRRVRV